jgi:hypothetical protein
MIQNTVVEVECCCDSDIMEKTLPLVAAKMRTSYHWVPLTDSIHLQMDNAGGHGTKEAIARYSQELEERFNIIVIHQPPRSPDSNALDLGLWMAIQSKVDYIHQSKTIKAESLALTTKAAWDELPADIISKVFG